MMYPDTPLADLRSGRLQIAAGLVMRLRAAGIATVGHLLAASKHSLALALPAPEDRRAVARWLGIIRSHMARKD